jgi:hypothetical protein
VEAAPISAIALEAVERIDAPFGIEGDSNGLSAEKRLGARRGRSVPLVAPLKHWMGAPSAPNSRATPRSPRRLLAHPLGRLRLLNDGRICLSSFASSGQRATLLARAEFHNSSIRRP